MSSDDYGIWGLKGATLSDKSARKEFGLTQGEIIAAIEAGRLQYRVNYMHGNPWFRLLRKEVEAFVQAKHGGDYAARKKLEKELADVNKELRQLKARTEALEQRKRELMAELGK